ncbi:NAD(P)-dependent oxidoreductase [Alphaproteobacteria bacterium]|nr:NAD(P)-dependent oxidoreductase [Alphaproteobacteria bacterium]
MSTENKDLFSNASLKNENVMLIGGSGFIGHHLALELKNKQANVLVLDNLQVNNIVSILGNSEINETKRQLYINFILERFKLMREADIVIANIDGRDLSALSTVYNDFKPTKIIHLAAISSAVVANNNSSVAYDIQINSLRNTINLCQNSNNCTNQLVFLSSSTVYGDFKEKSVDETVRPQPKGVYANGKYIGERMVREAKSLFNLDYTIVRPSALYGIRCISGRVSQKFIENALSKKPLILEGGGGGQLDFTHVDDLVEGIIRTLIYEEARSKTFNLTYGNARPISDLAKIIKKIIPEVELKEAPAAKLKPKRGTLNINRAKKLLNFVPNKPIEIGYHEFCQWYIKQWNKI